MKTILKTRIALSLLALFALMLGSCRDEIEVFQIERVPTFSFSNDNLTTEHAEEVNIYQGKTVIHYYSDGTSELFTRYLLTATGINAAGKKYAVNIEFDMVKGTSFIGIYRPEYKKNYGGMYSFNYVEGSEDSFKSYNLDPANLSEDFVRIERQNMDEKLLLGDFFAKLQSDADPQEKITFYDGTYKDISYVLE